MATRKQEFNYIEAAEKTKATQLKQNAVASQADFNDDQTHSTVLKQSAKTRPVSSDNINTEQIGVRVSKETKRKLKLLAVENDMTVNDIIRSLLNKALSGEIDIY